MAGESHNLQTIRENIKKALSEQYPDREIEAITDILFRSRLQLKKHEVGLKRNEIPAHKDLQWFDSAIRKLKAGYPVQYITGQAEFYGMVLDVTPEVLIPRPETEELVRWIMDGIPHPRPVIMDIGTGSGCIALALKKNMPGSYIMATDVDTAALVVASKNAAKLELDLQFIQHDILDKNPPGGLPTADIIASNPPYIPQHEKITMASHITAHEPPGALFVPDENPLLFYLSIARFARQHLREGGQLYLEVHEKFGIKVIDLLQEKGFISVELRQDINGKDRMIKAIRS
jgi:release factor glutamine methyltransferase